MIISGAECALANVTLSMMPVELRITQAIRYTESTTINRVRETDLRGILAKASFTSTTLLSVIAHYYTYIYIYIYIQTSCQSLSLCNAMLWLEECQYTATNCKGLVLCARTFVLCKSLNREKRHTRTSQSL